MAAMNISRARSSKVSAQLVAALGRFQAMRLLLSSELLKRQLMVRTSSPLSVTMASQGIFCVGVNGTTSGGGTYSPQEGDQFSFF